jgi:hypothetical protein
MIQEGKLTCKKKIKNKEMSCFEVLDILLVGLEASSLIALYVGIETK